MASHISRRMAGILRMPSQQTVSWLEISMSMLPKDGRNLAPWRKSWINHESSIFVHGNSHECSHQNRGSFFNDRQAWLWEFGISVAKESTFQSRSSASRWRWNVKRMRPWGQAWKWILVASHVSKYLSEINTNQMKAIISRNHGSGKWQKHWKDALVQKDIKMIHVFHALTLSISCTSPDPLFFTTHEKLVICMCMTRFEFDTCVGPQEGLYTQYHAGLCRAFASWLESGIEQHKVIL